MLHFIILLLLIAINYTSQVTCIVPPSVYYQKISTFERTQQGVYGIVKGVASTWAISICARFVEKTVDSYAQACASIQDYKRRKQDSYNYSKPSLTPTQAAVLTNTNCLLAKTPLELMQPTLCAVVTLCLGYLTFKLIKSTYSNLKNAVNGSVAYKESDVIVLQPEQLAEYRTL